MYKIVVFGENGSGEKKIQGITLHGTGLENIERFNIEEALPEFVDDPEEYIPEDFSADLVLDFLKHPDLSSHLAQVCKKKNIPVEFVFQLFALIIEPAALRSGLRVRISLSNAMAKSSSAPARAQVVKRHQDFIAVNGNWEARVNKASQPRLLDKLFRQDDRGGGRRSSLV